VRAARPSCECSHGTQGGLRTSRAGRFEWFERNSSDSSGSFEWRSSAPCHDLSSLSQRAEASRPGGTRSALLRGARRLATHPAATAADARTPFHSTDATPGLLSGSPAHRGSDRRSLPVRTKRYERVCERRRRHARAQCGQRDREINRGRRIQQPGRKPASREHRRPVVAVQPWWSGRGHARDEGQRNPPAGARSAATAVVERAMRGVTAREIPALRTVRSDVRTTPPESANEMRMGHAKLISA